MDNDIFYFDVKHAVEVHDYIIEVSGGLHGYRDIGLLESVLEHIQNDMYYPSFPEKLTHLVFAVNKFLLRMENIVVWVAEGKIGKELLGEIVASLIEDDDYNESLKLRMIEAVSK